MATYSWNDIKIEFRIDPDFAEKLVAAKDKIGEEYVRIGEVIADGFGVFQRSAILASLQTQDHFNKDTINEYLHEYLHGCASSCTPSRNEITDTEAIPVEMDSVFRPHPEYVPVEQ